MKINYITPDQSNFPKQLLNIASPPKQIFRLGPVPSDISPSIAIVGSRRPTTYGKQVTADLSRKLAEVGITIVSGLALGIDGLAHQACLDAKGRTIAVLGNGLDKIYPSSHRELGKQILASGGSIISEYETGTPALPQNFVARNRLISGLADAILITEAAIKSGSLHTANFALEQGKPVLVVPGNITSPMSAGTNQLIKTGALPVTDVSDILLALGLEERPRGKPKAIRGDDQAEQTIIDLLTSGLTDGEELQLKSKLNAIEFQQALTMLEISGKIRPLGANHWGLS